MSVAAPFRVGGTKIYLPKFTIALLRTPHLPPNFAQFEVPLNINKLDLRDYLFHAYNVRVKAVRSFVIQPSLMEARMQTGKRNAKRLPGIKRMTVELESPFVYPAEPEDLSPWDHELHKNLNKYREEEQKNRGPKAVKPGRKEMAELAESLLAGQSQQAVTVTEVEKDIQASSVNA